MGGKCSKRRWHCFTALAAGFGTAAAGPAAGPISLQASSHPGYGQLVFDLGERPQPIVIHTGDTVTIVVGDKIKLPGPQLTMRNLVDLTQDGPVLTLHLSPEVQVRPSAAEHRLVLDLLDAKSAPPRETPAQDRPRANLSPAPSTVAASAQPAKPAAPSRPAAKTAAPAAAPPQPVTATAVIPNQAASPQSAIMLPAPSAIPASPPPAQTPQPDHVLAEAPPAAAPPPPAELPSVPSVAGPMASAALTRPAPGDSPGHAMTLPFAPTVGAAAFARGRQAIVVFDTRAALDLKAVAEDPVFASADLRLLPNATLLSVTLPERTELRLGRSATGWTVTAIGGTAIPPALRPLRPALLPGGLSLRAQSPGSVLSVPDPLTGETLLIGTQLASGESVPASRQAPDFTLLPTWQGVLVQPASDAVRLRATTDGFSIGAEGEGRRLVMSAPSEAQERAVEARRMSRVFDFPEQSVDFLMRRMHGNLVVAAAAPPQSRLEPRKRVAESMLALGLGAEALAVLDVAVKDDARAADDPEVTALTSIASLLAGRRSDADGLDDQRLDGSDEIQFWRAVQDAGRQPDSASAAQVFANTLPLLQSYPAPLRERLQPVVAETMARGGQLDQVRALLHATKDDPALDLARAMAREAEGGDPGPALAMYDTLSHARDRQVSVRAAERSAELRLAKGLATPAQTAEKLGKLLLAWRDDSTDVDRRLRIAALQTQAGQFRAALASLRETEQLAPEQKGNIHDLLQASFAQALAPEAQTRMSAFDAVALATENGDLIPEGNAGQSLAEQLSARLTELDLPQQAAPMLERLAKAAPPGPGRATFGSRLAAARLELNDPAGAVAALAESTAETLPQALLEQRTLTFAAAVAAQHDLPSADHALRDLDTAAADQTMAQLHENAKDWPNAVQAWNHALERTLAADGVLNVAQATLLVRQASAATQAGDDATLARLRTLFAARMPPGKLADTFNLLTDRPVQTQADLPLVTREMGLVAAVPGALAAMAPLPQRASASR